MSVAFDPVTVRPDPALLAAVGKRLAQVLTSNRRLAQAPAINFHARRRIEAIIAGLIDALDYLDGDPDREQTACETRGAGFPCDPSAEDEEYDRRQWGIVERDSTPLPPHPTSLSGVHGEGRP